MTPDQMESRAKLLRLQATELRKKNKFGSAIQNDKEADQLEAEARRTRQN